MSSRRNIFKSAVSFALSCLVIVPALFLHSSGAIRAQDERQAQVSDHQAVVMPIKTQHVFAPHWTTEGGFQTTFYIRNVHIEQAFTARLSLILRKRTIHLPPVNVEPLQTLAIDATKSLAENGESIEQSGGAIIDFKAESAGAIAAYAHVLNTTKSLTFSFPFMQKAVSGPLDAVAWYNSKNTDAFLSLQNITDKGTKAVLTVFVSGRATRLGKRQLKPHEVVAMKLPSSQGIFNDIGQSVVGVRVESPGQPGALVAQGWVVDEAKGFSAPFTFHPKSNCHCPDTLQHKYGTGIMISKGGMSGPASSPNTELIFSPYLVTQNTSDTPLNVNPIFSYVFEDKKEKVELPAMILGPQENAVVNLRAYQEEGIIPSFVETGDVDLQYTGDADALVAELTSVDQNGSFVSPVPLICQGNRDSHMSFWRTDGDWHSSVTLNNITSEENNVEITISYAGGIYVLEKKIRAGETTMVSINELQQSQAPDQEGRRIPADATFGGVNIWGQEVSGLVVNAMLMNPVTKTCGQCTDPGYVTQYTLSDKAAYTGSPLYSDFDSHTVGQGFNIYLNVRYSSGSQSGDTPQTSSSSNTNVATAVSNYVNDVSFGTANVTANSRSGYFTDSACSQPGYLTPSRVSTLTVKGTPHHLKVVSDTTTTRSCGSKRRIITFQVVDTGGANTGTTRTVEAFTDPTSGAALASIFNSCQNSNYSPAACSSDNPDATFMDTLWVGCPSSGGDCGFPDVISSWYWCPLNGQQVKLAANTYHARHSQVLVNGGAQLAAGTNLYP